MGSNKQVYLTHLKIIYFSVLNLNSNKDIFLFCGSYWVKDKQIVTQSSKASTYINVKHGIEWWHGLSQLQNCESRLLYCKEYRCKDIECVWFTITSSHPCSRESRRWKQIWYSLRPRPERIFPSLVPTTYLYFWNIPLRHKTDSECVVLDFVASFSYYV